MKLNPEILRYAFLMQEVWQKDGVPDGAAHDRTPMELYNAMEEAIAIMADFIDFENQTVRPETSLRLFAEATATVANYCLMLCDNVNQLPVCRHGLIEAMNAHCV